MPQSRSNPDAMQFAGNTVVTMALLIAYRDADEVLVEAVKRLRFAESGQNYGAAIGLLNPQG